MRPASLVFAVVGVILCGTSTQAADPPTAVSPGLPDATPRIEARCPAFSWSAVPEAAAYRVVVYHVPERDASRAIAVIEQDLPRWALSWTPPLERCLAPGETYAWRVGAAVPDREPVWSEPAWFEVAGTELVVTPRLVEEVMRQLSVRTAADGDGSGIAEGAQPPRPRGPLPGGTASIPADRLAASYFSVGNGGAVTAGAVKAESFTGDGSAVTSVDAATLQGNVAAAFAAAAHAHDDRYFTEAELSTKAAGGAVHWANVTSVPDGFADDLDNDTTYSAGSGLALAGTQFSLAGADNSRPGHAITTLDSTGVVGSYTSVTIGADGLGLISYCDGTNGDLKVAHCSNVTCTAATMTTLDSTGSVGYYTSVTIGADGLGLISYLDADNANLKVAHCSNVTCTEATTATLDSTGDVGLITSVTIGADGLGLISYGDETNGDLKVAHCSNVTCTGATISTLDSTGSVGSYTSVTIGADGLGLISYRDTTNGDLKVAHCSDVSCTSATTATIDSAGDIGSYVSVTSGADGLPLISYLDDTDYDFKVAHCANVYCTPYFRRR